VRPYPDADLAGHLPMEVAGQAERKRVSFGVRVDFER